MLVASGPPGLDRNPRWACRLVGGVERLARRVWRRGRAVWPLRTRVTFRCCIPLQAGRSGNLFARDIFPRAHEVLPKRNDEARRDRCCCWALVPSGFRFGSGGASPSAWRFQEPVLCQVRGLEGSMPEQSLPRVMWGLDGASSDDCAPLAASAVRLGPVPRTFPAGFPTLLAGIAVAPSGQFFSVRFQGLIPDFAGWSQPLDTWRLRPLAESRKGFSGDYFRLVANEVDKPVDCSGTGCGDSL